MTDRLEGMASGSRLGPGLARPPFILLASLLALTAWIAFGPAAGAQIEPLPVREIAPGAYVYQGPHEEATPENLGGFANIGFIIGDTTVAVIDSGGSARQGQRLRAAIRSVTTLPIGYVIITHGHPDHMFGSAAFLDDGAVVVGHAKLPQAMAMRGNFYLARLNQMLGERAAGTKIVLPGMSVDNRLDLDLGGRVLRLTAFPTAHTDNDLTVFDVETRTLWAGDLLFMERLPVVDGSLKGWLAALEALRQVEAVQVVPGHGPPVAPWPAALQEQERYLRLLQSETRAIVDGGGRIEEAVESVAKSERGAWLLFDDNNPRNVVTTFTELEWE